MKTGAVRALATSSSPKRIKSLPKVPTVSESGYRGYEMDVWFKWSPAKTPKETITTLAGWFSRALHAPGVETRLANQGLYPLGTCGADFGAFLRRKYDDYGAAVQIRT